ncbi:MAG: RidA family protein [Rhizobiales bacterium]|nr:RidA family protein [Hyphomicrobiales bacterium]
MTSNYHAEVEKRLADQGITLPEAMAPAANYVPFKIAGTMLYVSGQLPMGADGQLIKGTCGRDIDTAGAAEAAKRCALNVLAQARAALGDFDRIVGLSKITGFVSSTGDFLEHPAVVNGASNLFVDALGERGRHARSAVGLAALPFGVAVEVEAIFEIKA